MEPTTPGNHLDRERLSAVLQQEIIPYVEMHGGTIEVVEIVGMTVRVRLRGACERCNAAIMTLRVGIERLLRRTLDPAIRVERVP